MNPINEVKVIAVDIAHGAEAIVGVGESVYKLLADIKTLTPEFKAELAKLVTDAEPVATILAPVIAAEGTNVALDLEAVAPVLADIKILVAGFVAFPPPPWKLLLPSWKQMHPSISHRR